MEVANYLKKIKLLLENLLEGKIVINDSDAEKLLNYLADSHENSIGKQILEAPFFSDLILLSLKKIHNANISTKVFLIKIVTILFKSELHFTQMQIQGFQNLFCNVCILANMNSLPTNNLHLASIKLATMELTHRSGLSVIVQNKAWESILQPNIHHKQKEISKAAYNFLAKLVWKLNEYYAESVLLEVFEYIVKPIISSEYLNVLIIDSETDTALFDKICPYLSALLAIMIEGNSYAPENKVTAIFKANFNVQDRLYEIFTVTKNLQLLKLLNVCLIQYYCQMNRHLLFNEKTDEYCITMVAFHRDHILRAVKKREPYAIVDFVTQSVMIWSRVEKSHSHLFKLPLTYGYKDKTFEFSTQIIIHALVPFIKYLLLYRIANQMERTDALQQLIAKIGKNITDCIYLCGYLFGVTLAEGCISFRKKVTTHALKEILRLKDYLNETQAGIVFRTLYYLLEIFVLCDGEGGLVVHETPLDPDDLRMLTHLLNAMKMLLKEHNIPWFENLEVVNIKADLLNLLKQSFLPTKVVVQVLDLINICVKKFLSPNMSLLVEDNNTQSSTVNEIGQVIKLYTQHEDWEIRDSAFNLLSTCTEISFIKYIPLQRVIKTHSLILLASKAALTDPEYYCQSVALQCLTAATKNDAMWQEVMADNPDLYLHVIDILKNHGEGVVRKEAVNVLTGVYANQKVAPDFQQTLYQVMLSAALDDLHWEVQLAALNFWKCAIHNQLTYRGMLDGKFPSVTFSKEKRKIITLNDVEIRRQLTAIMNHLSNIGCLTVLLECMNEEYNTEVMELAFQMAKELTEMLDTYKFEKIVEDGESQTLQEQPEPMDEDSCNPMDLTQAPNEVEQKGRDNVIDSILRLSQNELIMHLHDNADLMRSDDNDLNLVHCTRKKLVHPNKFLENFKMNFQNITIDNKRDLKTDYTSTLDGLLDEILNSHEIT